MSAEINALSYILNGTYNVDKNIIQLSRQMLIQANDYFQTGEHLNTLRQSYEKFYLEVSIYSNVEWTRIKDQSKGKHAENMEWDDSYQNIRYGFDKKK